MACVLIARLLFPDWQEAYIQEQLAKPSPDSQLGFDLSKDVDGDPDEQADDVSNPVADASNERETDDGDDDDHDPSYHLAKLPMEKPEQNEAASQAQEALADVGSDGENLREASKAALTPVSLASTEPRNRFVPL
jgi:hypothetical protein